MAVQQKGKQQKKATVNMCNVHNQLSPQANKSKKMKELTVKNVCGNSWALSKTCASHSLSAYSKTKKLIK